MSCTLLGCMQYYFRERDPFEDNEREGGQGTLSGISNGLPVRLQPAEDGS
jgi:hypothetical protein